MTDEKSVADVADESTKVAEAESTQDTTDTLDTLLAQYDEENQAPVKPEPAKESSASTDDALAEIRQWKQEQQAEKTQADLLAAAKTIRGEVPETAFDDEEIISWMDAQAKKHAGFLSAFTNRRSDPKKWEKAQEDFGALFQKKFSPVFDKQVTDDRAAVSAAVRGASTNAPDSEGPSLAEIRSWPQDKQDSYAREVSRQYAKGASQ